MENIIDPSEFKGNSLFVLGVKTGLERKSYLTAIDMICSQAIDNRRAVCEVIGVENVKRCFKFMVDRNINFHSTFRQ